MHVTALRIVGEGALIRLSASWADFFNAAGFPLKNIASGTPRSDDSQVGRPITSPIFALLGCITSHSELHRCAREVCRIFLDAFSLKFLGGLVAQSRVQALSVVILLKELVDVGSELFEGVVSVCVNFLSLGMAKVLRSGRAVMNRCVLSGRAKPKSMSCNGAVPERLHACSHNFRVVLDYGFGSQLCRCRLPKVFLVAAYHRTKYARRISGC